MYDPSKFDEHESRRLVKYDMEHREHLLKHDQLLQSRLKEVCEIRGSILDVGCGWGHLVSYFAQLPKVERVVGIEWDLTRLHVAMEKVQGTDKATIVHGNVYSIPFEDEKFDIVVSINLFEHLDEPSHALKEILRIMKREGTLYLQCPSVLFLSGGDMKSWVRDKLRGIEPEVRQFYTFSRMQRYVEQAGGRIITKTFFRRYAFLNNVPLIQHILSHITILVKKRP